MINRQTTILVAVVVVGIGLIWFLNISREGSREPEISLSGLPSMPTVTPVSSPAVSKKPLFSQQPEVTDKYPPAECILTGSIVFRSPTLYENKNANITYKNIDSVARHIIWSTFPYDNLSVGPNLFASLPLPDGIEDVTVNLPANPKSKNYVLTAKVTYGRIINKNLEVKESSCTGQIPVQLNY